MVDYVKMWNFVTLFDYLKMWKFVTAIDHEILNGDYLQIRKFVDYFYKGF